MHISALPTSDAFARLRSGADGLAADEAARRLAEFGPNQLPERPPRPLHVRLLLSFANFFALILAVAAGLAFFAEHQEPGQGMATLGWAILGVIAVNGLFSFVQEARAQRAIEALRKLLPHVAKVLRGGTLQHLPATALVPGDVIVLDEGDDVPADARVVWANALRVSNATITGESAPVERDAEPQPVAGALGDATNLVLAGTQIVSGEARALVFATGARTEFGRIAHLAQAPREHLSPLQREVVRLSRVIAVLSVVLGAIFFVAGQLLGLAFWNNFLFAIGIIVANVPEGLLPTVTLALAMASQRMARRNALIRHLPAVETLGAATVICSDKTGTLTQNRMTPRRLVIAGAEGPHPLGPEEAIAAPPARPLLVGAALCHHVRGDEHPQGDPMEIALRALGRRGVGSAEPPRLGEIPFSPERRRQSTLHELEGARRLLVKGAPETVLDLCATVAAPDGAAPLDDAARARWVAAAEALGEDGFRVLAFADRVLPPETPRDEWERSLRLTGLVGLEDPPRPEVPDAVRRCREAGIRVIMVTGDHPRTARAVARQIGLVTGPEAVVRTGAELRALRDAELQLVLDAPEVVLARTAPEDKLRVVHTLQRKREIVAVTGDGVNDAPALRQADIGIAMGRDGTDVARSAADIVLTDDNFASIVAAVEEGRAVFANIRKFLTYILTSNIPELVPYLAFVLLRVPLALTIIQILAVDLGTDILPALALGAEPPTPGLMRRPPRRPDERLVDAGLLARAYGLLGVIEAAAALFAFFWVLRAGGWAGGSLGRRDPLYLVATTAALAAIVVSQIGNVFACRDELASVLARRITDNKLLLAAIGAELVLLALVVYTPPGQAAFGTAPLAPREWLLGAPFALLLLAADEVRKAWARTRSRRRGVAAGVH